VRCKNKIRGLWKAKKKKKKKKKGKNGGEEKSIEKRETYIK